MGEYVTVAAVMTVARPRVREWLRAAVVPASTWTDWSGVEGWDDAAVAECDRWLEGDYAGLLHELVDDSGLRIGFDEATGSLTVDFDARVDFRLPSLIWAFTVFRGLADVMVDDDAGLVTVTGDWDDAPVALHLSPGRSEFVRGAALARAADLEFDVRCAVGDVDDPATEVLDRLLGP
ncbi:hypothetical protein GCM10022243_10280 [Saccharothrix violaceirubra]|uniref:Uncharacterized protein n=1 Tax=Saccharothrix violaceirubra TaxID=413306 RepID=A0A7W7T513_9PSEU|nr:hypothetical protein [Saccharothrix violaceirubra]MBB4966132.1 hypothetical protein [Saccharothrix violaceirubra]